jgi:hypothetical protein
MMKSAVTAMHAGSAAAAGAIQQSMAEDLVVALED